MNDVQWWLFALSFVMGLALTLALTVRPVKRQVPVGAPSGPGSAADNETEPTVIVGLPVSFLVQPARFMSLPWNSGSQNLRVEQ